MNAPITPLQGEISEKLDTYLLSWFATSRAYQLGKGRRFELTYAEFLELWGAKRLRTMQKHMDNGSVYARMNASNMFGFVLTWKSYAAKQTGILCRETAQVCMRQKSRRDNTMKKGDRHTPEAIEKISAAKRGKTHSAEHKKAISESMKGIKRGPMSQEEKDKRSASMKATLAAKRAALGGAA